MTQIQLRRDTSTNWSTNNPTPASGEPCYETDTGKLKIGNGTTPYNDLEYIGNDGGETYTLPPATVDTLGGVKVGNNLSITDDGTLSATSSTPSNMVTTNTEQTITAQKIFSGDTYLTGTTSTVYTSGYGISLNGRYLRWFDTSGRNRGGIYADSTANSFTIDASAYSPGLRIRANTINRFNNSDSTDYEIIDASNLQDYLVAGSNITLSPASDGKVTINSTGGGSTPTNMVTTDTNQTITGQKTFNVGLQINGDCDVSSQLRVYYPGHQGMGCISYLDSGDGLQIYPTSTVGSTTFSIGADFTQNYFTYVNIKASSYASFFAGGNEILRITPTNIQTFANLEDHSGIEVAPYLTTADNGTIANLGMPSISAFTDETLPASGTATTATEAGYLYIDKTAASVGEYIQVTISDTSSNVVYSDDKYAVVANQALKLMVPIPDGCSYTVSYTATGTTNNYRFIKTTGQNT